MQRVPLHRVLAAAVLSCVFLLAACSDDSKSGTEAKSSAETVTAPADVIARVGDEVITYTQLSTMLNSSAMVGLSVPALGTPERNQVIITLLDKAISANLLYLDAKAKGVDRLTAYTEDVKKFEDAILASLYRDRYMIGDIPVHEKDIIHYYNLETERDEDLTGEMKQAIESKVRKQKLEELKSTLRERLREGVDVDINERVLDPLYDGQRTDADVVATVGDRRFTWAEVKDTMRGADRRVAAAQFYIDSDVERLKRLNQLIDNYLLAEKGRDAGLMSDPTFEKRAGEYRKTRLITLHRSDLIHDWNPGDEELKSYYVENMDRIVVPEMRKIQMVLLETREEAEEVRERIENGEITVYQAARDHSIDPNAKQTLGEMGWVSQGSGFEEIDDFTFNLEPEVLSEPVQSPAGWHLIRVTDVTDAQYDDFDDPRTRKRTLRLYMQDRFNEYVVDLRRNRFDVEVYDDALAGHFRKEAEIMAELGKKAQQEGSVTEQRRRELEQWMPASSSDPATPEE